MVVKAWNALLSDDDVIAHCRTKLAAYKRSRYVVFFNELLCRASGDVLKYVTRGRYAVLCVPEGTARVPGGSSETVTPIV